VFELTDRYSLLCIGHMAQMGKKNLNLFQNLCMEKAAKAKAFGSTKVPNLQEPLVEFHVHGGSNRKAELSVRAGRGKDVKKVRATFVGAKIVIWCDGTRGWAHRVTGDCCSS